MNQIGFPLVSTVLWLPALGALLLLLVPRTNVAAQRALALGVALATFGVSVALPFLFNFNQPGFQLVDAFAWIPQFGVGYQVSVDGISLWLVLMVALLTPVVLAATWSTIHEDTRTFLSLLLLLETGLLGVFVAQDMLLFFIFFEFTLIPTALLIGMYGGANRERAASQFFLYNFVGSIFMLLGIIGVYVLHGQQTGTFTFDIATVTNSVQTGALEMPVVLGRLLFGAFFLAFAIKAPLWPFHTWLPLAHTEASSDGSVDVLGLLIKIGAYGFIRFNLQLFPEASRWAAPAIGVLAVISILYGAWVAYAQTDMKRLLAYSSVSHVGFIILGIFALNPLGISGAVLQIVNQGLTSGALFLIIGMIYARRHTREMTHLNGLWKVMPIYGGLTLAVIFASAGLPGLNGFIGEFTIMQGAWVSPFLGWGFLFPAVIGVILAAAYLLRMFARAFMGDATEENATLTDINGREIGLLVVLLIPIVAIGLYPNLLFEPMQPVVEQISQGLAAIAAR